jgi:hypothetical protein
MTSMTGPDIFSDILKKTHGRLFKNNSILSSKDGVIQYDLIFNKSINYTNEIHGLFDTVSPTLKSKSKIVENKENLIITMENSHKVIVNDIDIVLMMFTAVYYDCDLVITTDKIGQFKTKVVDGHLGTPRLFSGPRSQRCNIN